MPAPGSDLPNDEEDDEEDPDDGFEESDAGASSGEENVEPAGEEPRDFTGLLLVSHPGLKDPNFRRSVLFMSAHDRESGAMGLILNRPLEGKTAADLLPDHEAAALLSQVPVYLGGPVGRDQLSFGEMRLGSGPAGALRFRHHLTLPDAIALAGKPSGLSRLRAFIGYAGWGGGQLEAEMAQSAWMLVPPEARFFTRRTARREDRSWFRVMGSLGPVYRLLAAVPDDLSLN